MKIPQEPAEPIRAENKAEFEAIRDRVIAELEGRATEAEYITDDDIFRRKAEAQEAADSTSTATTEQPAEKR